MKVMGATLTPTQLRIALRMKGHEPSAFNRCVGAKLFKTHPKDQAEARANFSAAAKSCK